MTGLTPSDRERAVEHGRALLKQAEYRMPTSDRPSSSGHPTAAFAGLLGAKARRKIEDLAPTSLAGALEVYKWAQAEEDLRIHTCCCHPCANGSQCEDGSAYEAAAQTAADSGRAALNPLVKALLKGI